MKKPVSTADGPITKALLDAVTMRRQMLDKGHDAAEVDHIVGQGLKALLSNRRSEPWRFYCERCRDTGWSEVLPSPDEESRLMALYGSIAEHQGYSVKCEPCRWTQMEREKRRQILGQDEVGEDDFAAAGQTKKPTRGFKRFGR